ncbi:hypothetical protein C8R42DRAFT_28357 [Lentinula raphanica]|nr:hypothetical protein C8R42DRAFT_28357 [Lentinula raphanica]
MPVMQKQLHWSTQLNLVELRLRQFYVTEPHIITEQIADNLRNGAEILLPWILPVLKAFKNKHDPNPETVPDKYSSFRVTKLTYLGSSTHNQELIMCDVPVPPPKPPSGGYSHNVDEYWLYILVRINANLSVLDFFKFALVGRAGYGSGPVKDQFALIAPNTFQLATSRRLAFRSTSQSGNPVEPNLGKQRLWRDKLCSCLNGPVGPRIHTRWMSQTMLTVPRRDQSFHSSEQGRGSSRAVAGDIEGGTSEEGPEGGSGGRCRRGGKSAGLIESRAG